MTSVPDRSTTRGRPRGQEAPAPGIPAPRAAQPARGKQPSLSQLRAFAAVAEHLHFRDAAGAIGMSQPALSGAVAALEETLGVQLLERTTRKVLLSPAGERMAARARTVLHAVGELLEEAEAARAPFTGVLRLGVIPTVAPYLLPTVLGLVHERYPDLDLQVHEEQTASLLDGVSQGRLDLLLLALPLGATGAPGTSRIREIPLFEEDFVLVTPHDHPCAGRRDLPRSVLRELDLLLLDEGHCMRDQALDICREAGRAEGHTVTTSAAGLSTLVQLVAGGMGVTLLPRTAVQVEAGRNEALRTGYFTDPAPLRRVGLALRAGAAREEEFGAFADALRGALRGLPVRLVLP